MWCKAEPHHLYNRIYASYLASEAASSEGASPDAVIRASTREQNEYFRVQILSFSSDIVGYTDSMAFYTNNS